MIKVSCCLKRLGKFIDVKIVCLRFGVKCELIVVVINLWLCLKMGCKVGFYMKRKEDEKWVIVSFVKEYNYEICLDDFYVSVRGKNKFVVGVLVY